MFTLARQRMEERTIGCLVSFLDHLAFESISGNALQLSHGNFHDCTVLAAPKGLNVCVASVHLLSFRPCARLDVMISCRVCRRCTRTLLPFAVPKGEAAPNGKTTTASSLPSLMFAYDTSTRPSGRWYADDGSAMTSSYDVS